MNARRPNIPAASFDLGFAIAAFACGLAGLPWLAVTVGIAAVAVWAYTRRGALSRMAGAHLIGNIVIALVVLAIVLGGAYWLGTLLRGAP